ncbi:MAG: ester cyclase [Actinomycetota bacterium]|nr:ester cyclase [Actinomycetota bacterium]
MSEENKAVARRGIEEFLNTGDPDVADELFAAGYVDYNPFNPELSGVENIKKTVVDWHGAFHHARNTVEDVIAEGDKVVIRWSTRGIHRGKVMGITPAGNRVAVASIGIFRFSSGKIVESWDEHDAMGLLRQLGASPLPGQGGD